MNTNAGLVAFGRHFCEPDIGLDDYSNMYSTFNQMAVKDIGNFIDEVQAILAAVDPHKEMRERWSWSIPPSLLHRADAVKLLTDARDMAAEGLASGEFDGSLAALERGRP